MKGRDRDRDRDNKEEEIEEEKERKKNWKKREEYEVGLYMCRLECYSSFKEFHRSNRQ